MAATGSSREVKAPNRRSFRKLLQHTLYQYYGGMLVHGLRYLSGIAKLGADKPELRKDGIRLGLTLCFAGTLGVTALLLTCVVVLSWPNTDRIFPLFVSIVALVLIVEILTRIAIRMQDAIDSPSS